MNIAQGITTANDWETYTTNTYNRETRKNFGGIYVEVDTKDCNFKTTPHYIVTVEGTDKGGHWLLSGANSVYNATPTGFRVYLRWTDYAGFPGAANPLTRAEAKKYGWFIRWTAISTSKCDCN